MNCRERITEGESLFKEGKIELAESMFNELLCSCPENHEVLNNLGVIHYSRENLKKAEECFLHAMKINENYTDALMNLANVYKALERWKEAALQLEKYLEIESEDYAAFNQLGFMYLEQGDTLSACRHLEKSLYLNADQPEIIHTVTIIKNKKKTNTFSDAGSAPVVVTQMRPLVSVGLPVYNGGKTIKEAIESILTQEFREIELIISDNCSTDDTEKICTHYSQLDQRIKYYRQTENMGAFKNFYNVFGLSHAPYYMWISHDDLRESAFIGRCLENMETDASIALVYPRTKVLNAESQFIGIAADHVTADHDNPCERFRHLIWEIGMCNMFYGLHRSNVLKKTRSWGKSLFSDNLLLAEITLMGKIVQIEDVLFVRRLTRDYRYKNHDDRNAQLISEIEPAWFKDGITLPHCRLAYAHLELVNYSDLKQSEKNFMISDILKCFRTRFAQQMKYEINRAVELLKKDIFFYSWGNKWPYISTADKKGDIDYFYISNLMKNLQEAMFIFPERADLKDAFDKCLKRFSEYTISQNGL